MTDLAPFASVSESEGIRGAVSASTQRISRRGGIVVSETAAPASVQPQISVLLFGNLAQTISTAAVVNSFACDGLNRRAAQTGGCGTTSITAYDAFGQTACVENAAANRTSFAYDKFGHVVETIDALDSSVFTAYDIRSNTITQWGTTYPVWYEYDAEGRMSAMATTRNSGADPAASVANPLELAYSYLPGTRLVSEMSAFTGHSFTRAFEPHRNLISAITNAFGGTVVYAFDYENDAIGRRVKRNADTFNCNARSEVIATNLEAGAYTYMYDLI